VDAPRRATPEYSPCNEHLSAAFLAVVDKDELAALCRPALLTGMRRGKILGLKWGDLDLTRGLLSVKRTLSRGAVGGFSLGLPKTAHGKRTIVLPPSAVERLKRHWVKQIEERLALGIAYAENDFVFADSIGQLIYYNTL
jgi:integrase